MILEAVNISKQLSRQIVLKEINLKAVNGESIAIFGPNGAGKTTLINILSTLMKSSSGKILCDSEDVFADLLAFRKKIGLVSHEPLAYPELSLYDNLKFFGKMYGVKDLSNGVEEMVELIGLSPFLHREVREFSRGMMQRFMIAKALLHKPDLLLLDEPFTGLDASARHMLVELIRSEWQRGKIIIFSTHDLELGYEAASKFLFLINGFLEDAGEKASVSLAKLKRGYENRLSMPL